MYPAERQTGFAHLCIPRRRLYRTEVDEFDNVVHLHNVVDEVTDVIHVAADSCGSRRLTRVHGLICPGRGRPLVLFDLIQLVPPPPG